MKTTQTSQPPQDSSEIWKLRCTLLAEKYFEMLKDMRHNLINIRVDAIETIQIARKEFEERIMIEFRHKLTNSQDTRMFLRN